MTEQAPEQQSAIDPEQTVHEVVQQHPEAREVFESFGFDLCCGSDRTLREQAEDKNADLGDLLRWLERAIGENE